jgi:hypothetical protein
VWRLLGKRENDETSQEILGGKPLNIGNDYYFCESENTIY